MHSNVTKPYRIKVTGLLFFILIPLILPDYFSQLGTITSIFTLITGTAFLILVCLTVLKKRFNLFVIISIFFVAWRSFSSYYFSSEILDIVNSIRIISIMLLINLTIKNFPKSTLQSLSLVFALYSILNFITYLLFPNGLYLVNLKPAWLLGEENQFGFFLIPAMILIVIDSWYRYQKVSWASIVLISIITINLIMAWSATSVVAGFFVLFSILLNLQKKIKPLYSFFTLSIAYIILWLVIVRANSISFFETIIINILGKDLTFSGRTRIWDAVFDKLPESLWNGFGINSEVLAGWVTYFAAHNMILQVLLDIGIIGLIILLICIIVGGIKLQKYKSKRITVLLLIGIFGILIGGLTESYRLNYLFLLLTLAFNVNFLIKQSSKYVHKT